MNLLLVVWALSTLAAYRLWRLLALDTLPPVAKLRGRIIDAADRRGWDEWADGIGCPWCLGFWCCVAVFVVVNVTYPYSPWPLLVVQIAAASTVVGIIGGSDRG